jgi:hypothetical protein
MSPEVFSKYFGLELEKYVAPNYFINAKNVSRNGETFIEINSDILKGSKIIIHSMESDKMVYPNPDSDIFVAVVNSLYETIESYDFDVEDDVITFGVPKMIGNILEEFQDSF